jgi:hypothetical protein
MHHDDAVRGRSGNAGLLEVMHPRMISRGGDDGPLVFCTDLLRDADQ